MTVAAISAEAAWAGGAVVLASLIAFVGVRLQTSKTLKAEQKRLEVQLEAEKTRLRMQLTHDRATRERGELRTVLDAAALALDRLAFAAIEAMTAAETVLGTSEGERAQTEEGEDAEQVDDGDPLEAKLRELFALIRAVDGHTAQIGMRLGSDHVVKVAYQEARGHFGDLNRKLIDLDIDASDEKGLTEPFIKAGAKKKEFEQASFDVIRSELQ